jgi:hypothetical protein
MHGLLNPTKIRISVYKAVVAMRFVSPTFLFVAVVWTELGKQGRGLGNGYRWIYYSYRGITKVTITNSDIHVDCVDSERNPRTNLSGVHMPILFVAPSNTNPLRPVFLSITFKPVAQTTQS